MATEPNGLLLNGITPVVHLAGKDWPIPDLAPRQNRIVVPAFFRVLPKLGGLAQGGNITAERIAALASIDEKMFDDLANIVYFALTRAHPTLEREEFDDMPIGMLDMAMCLFPVIAHASGLVSKDDKKLDAKPGEAKAGRRQTGTK